MALPVPWLFEPKTSASSSVPVSRLRGSSLRQDSGPPAAGSDNTCATLVPPLVKELHDRACENCGSHYEHSVCRCPVKSCARNAILTKALRVSLALETPTSPYRLPHEQRAFKFFVENTVPILARSPVSTVFWTSRFVRTAWQQPSVRHALLSLSLAAESSFQRFLEVMRRHSATAI